MVEQRHSAKTSNVRALESQIERATPGTLEVMGICLSADLPVVTKALEKRLVKFRGQLLIRLANSRDDLSPFRTRMAQFFEPESDEMYRNARRDLRGAWQSSTSRKQRQRLVNAWLAAGAKRIGRELVTAPLGLGRLVLNPCNFPAQLAVAILENWRRFAICGNPDCVVPFFLAKRKTQKFCEQGECTRYAQNKYALRWWQEHRSKRARAQDKKVKRRKSHGTRKAR